MNPMGHSGYDWLLDGRVNRLLDELFAQHKKQKTILEDFPLINGGLIKSEMVKKDSDFMLGIEEAVNRGYKNLIIPAELKNELTIASSPIDPTKEPPPTHNPITLSLLIARAHGINVMLDEKIKWLPVPAVTA